MKADQAVTKLTCVLFISHASIKQVNRAVYRILKDTFQDIHVIIPSSLILSSGKRITAEPALADDPELIPLKLIGRNPRLYSYEGLHNILEIVKPGIIILENDPASRLGFILSTWCKRNRAKLICQSYENMGRGFKDTLTNQGWKALLKNIPIHVFNFFMSKRVHAIFVINKEGETIYSKYGFKRVKRIPLGFDKKVFFAHENKRKEFRTILKVKNEEVLISFFGRMVFEKGVHILIEALAELRDYNWKLLLDNSHDSNNEYVEFIHELIRNKKLEDKVLYFEADHFEIANYMRASDVVVAPSLVTKNFKEQYGRVIQEAMACGCVCLVSNSGHLPDLVGSNLLVFNQNNPDDLKNLMLGIVFSDNEKSALRQDLINRANSDLTTEKQAELIAEVINRI